eukprot:400400-Prymnesium_polylepis.2
MVQRATPGRRPCQVLSETVIVKTYTTPAASTFDRSTTCGTSAGEARSGPKVERAASRDVGR